jgi:hypothetical protein
LTVVHTAEDTWVVLDGVNDPDEDGAVVIEAMAHLVEADPTLSVLARLDIGHRADRERVGKRWQVFPD